MVREMRPLEYGSEYIDYDPFCESLIGRGFQPYVVELEVARAISGANREFHFVTGTSTHLRVTTTGSYKKVDIVSSTSNDASSANRHCRKVKFWGVDSNNHLRVEQVTMTGTAAVSSSNQYYEVGNIYASVFGTGGTDTAGQIRLGYTGKASNEIVEITSAKTMGLSTRVPIPKYWRAKILNLNVRASDADVALSSGVMVFPHYYDEYDCADEESSNGKVDIMRDGTTFGKDDFPRVYGNDNTYSILEFYGNRIKNSETWILKGRVAMWATSKATSNNKYLRGDR